MRSRFLVPSEGLVGQVAEENRVAQGHPITVGLAIDAPDFIAGRHPLGLPPLGQSPGTDRPEESPVGSSHFIAGVQEVIHRIHAHEMTQAGRGVKPGPVPEVAKSGMRGDGRRVMKPFLLPLLALGLLTTGMTGARADYFDEIRGDLTGPAVAGSPKFTALYFSAHWCPPCRTFTPKLIAWYNDFKATHPDFELVFVSGDRSEQAMKEYIEEAGMPWPAVAFDKTDEEHFSKFAARGIPYLVLIDQEGKALTAQPGNEWQAPEEVMGKIPSLVPSGS